MEPKRQTASHLLGVQQELIDREPIFHHPEHGTTRNDFEAMIAAEFWETGGFYCREIAPDNYLLTYTLRQGPRVTRRLTLWRQSADSWQVVYHQGTVLEQT